MIGSTRIDDLELAVLRLNLEVQANTMNVEKLMLAVHTEPPEPEPDLEATIRSLHESNVDLRGQLADAKRTELDLEEDIRKLEAENKRLTKLAWQAEQDKQAADALVRTYLGQLKAGEDNVERARQERDLALKQRDDLARDAGSLIGARALNEALTQKQHMLEAKNNELVERLERHRDCIDRTADALELLGFQVFAPGVDICDND
jgi:hypothetical protein